GHHVPAPGRGGGGCGGRSGSLPRRGPAGIRGAQARRERAGQRGTDRRVVPGQHVRLQSSAADPVRRRAAQDRFGEGAQTRPARAGGRLTREVTRESADLPRVWSDRGTQGGRGRLAASRPERGGRGGEGEL